MMSAVLTVTLTESFHSSSDYQKANERVLLNLVSELSASALLIEEFSDLQSYFEQLTEQPDVVQLQLVDLNNVVVASSHIQAIGLEAQPLVAIPPNYSRSFKVSTPAGELGNLTMEFTNLTLTEANRRIRNQGIATAITGMIVIFIIGILAGFILTRRLDLVTKAAVRFANGDESAQSNVSGSDELGSLGSTFDQMVKDVSEKQNLLVKQHKRIQLLMDSTAEGIIGIDTQHACSFANNACLEKLGLTEKDLLSNSISTYIELPDDVNSIDFSRTQFETDQAFAVAADGARIPVEFRSHPVVLEGQSVGAVCTFVDITQRKQHENELALHREHLEELVVARAAKLAEQAKILDQIHDSVVSTDMGGIIQTWNQGAYRLFGYDENVAKGKHIRFLFPKEEHNLLDTNLFNPLKEKGEFETEGRMMKKSGQTFFAHLSLSIKVDDKNQAVGMIAYVLDITDRKRAEEEVHRKSIQLEMANKELESFSYSVSHDLRAPLRSIRGFSQYLSEDYRDKLDAEGQDILDRIVNATGKMGQIIEDILSLSRVTSYKMRWGNVDLSKLSNEVIKDLRDADPGRQIKISVESNMMVQGDDHLLRILLVNLISNAWKYSSKTTAASIEIGSTFIQNCKVFYVKDNGAGFNMKYADKLFGAFQRLHSANEFEGTGIGLATAARVVHRHHGQIWAESEEGKGATFYFRLSILDSGSVVTHYQQKG